MNGKYAVRLGSSAFSSGQYLGIFGRSEHLEPEKAFLLTVLEDAIHRFRKCRSAVDGVGQARFREVDSWLQQRGREWVLSFDNVCELLGIAPEYLRRKLVGEALAGKKAEPQLACLPGSTLTVSHRSWQGVGSLVELLDRRR